MQINGYKYPVNINSKQTQLKLSISTYQFLY